MQTGQASGPPQHADSPSRGRRVQRVQACYSVVRHKSKIDVSGSGRCNGRLIPTPTAAPCFSSSSFHLTSLTTAFGTDRKHHLASTTSRLTELNHTTRSLIHTTSIMKSSFAVLAIGAGLVAAQDLSSLPSCGVRSSFEAQRELYRRVSRTAKRTMADSAIANLHRQHARLGTIPWLQRN